MDTSEFFDLFYNNATQNSVIIMNPEGFILKVNDAFATSFGYSNEDLVEKNFSLLFTEEDKKAGKPEMELQKVKSKGAASDDNYLVHKDGLAVWTSGESVFIHTNKGENYIIKVNSAFIKMFEIETPLKEGNSLTDLNHPFWKREDIKKEIRNIIVTNTSVKEKQFQMQTRSGETKTIYFHSKPIHVEPTFERKILIMIKEST